MKRKKNKKVLLVILLIIGLILVGTGTSLAYFSYKEDIGNKILLGDDAFIALEDLPEELEFGYEIEPDPSAFLGNGGVIGSYEFMVRGHNTSEKPIYYSIYLEHGEDVPGKVRIDDNLFISQIVNSNDFSFNIALINNFEVPIYIGKIEGGSEIDEEIIFQMELMLLPFNLSDTDPNALYSASTEGVIKNGKPKMSDLFGSFKIKMVASTKKIDLLEIPYIAQRYEKGDENGVDINGRVELMLITATFNSEYEMVFERPSRSSGILASSQPGFGTGFAVDYTAETSTFNFYLGRHEYHFQYPHNDNDVVNGVDKIQLNITPETVTINGTEFELTNGSQEGTSPDFYLQIGYGGPADVGYYNSETGNYAEHYHMNTYPDFEGKFYYLKIDQPEYGGIISHYNFIPLRSKNGNESEYAIIEKNSGMFYAGATSLESLLRGLY